MTRVRMDTLVEQRNYEHNRIMMTQYARKAAEKGLTPATPEQIELIAVEMAKNGYVDGKVSEDEWYSFKEFNTLDKTLAGEMIWDLGLREEEG